MKMCLSDFIRILSLPNVTSDALLMIKQALPALLYMFDLNFVNQYTASAPSSSPSPSVLPTQHTYRHSSLIESPPSTLGLSRWSLIASEGSISLQLRLKLNTNYFPAHFKHLQLPLYPSFTHIPVQTRTLQGPGDMSAVRDACAQHVELKSTGIIS